MTRSHFGTENLIIILLTLPEDCTFERVSKRHNGAEDFAQDFQDWGKKAFDPVKEEEECVHVLEMEDQMTGEVADRDAGSPVLRHLHLHQNRLYFETDTPSV